VCFDVPDDPTAFVHSAGRTARRGQRGLVTCLVGSGEVALSAGGYKAHHALRPAAPLRFQT